ncbi:MAG TPA: di-heme oxidoredictase family protein, partial [Burkholderiales bacterium]|nr:di-heme oxidoredictase family protein [Burkholderiales bacterium]
MRAGLAVQVCSSSVLVGCFLLPAPGFAQTTAARDPGVRPGPAAAGGPLPFLSRTYVSYFNAGRADFVEVETVEDGLGPTMNLDSCGGCHSQPAIGGTSPALNPPVSVNPQVVFAGKMGNAVPSFLSSDGPIREARFVRNANGTPDGGVHSLFVVPGCGLRQEDFATAVANRNVIFRIPTPLFGAGLIEQIPDSAILANLNADGTRKRSFGIGGRANRVRVGTITGVANTNGNDGTISRFGWKAQNQSLLLFSGEAYNVEMGISNELFSSERNQTAACQRAPIPNDATNPDAGSPLEAFSAVEKFTFFMRFLAPPTPSTDTPGGAQSIANGRTLFSSSGCALCHTPTLNTGNAAVPALRNKAANLYSDLAVHNMGPGLADGVT